MTFTSVSLFLGGPKGKGRGYIGVALAYMTGNLQMADKNSAAAWWQPERHADRRGLLLARNRIQARIRAWLAERDFIEVDPSALAISPGNEAHLHGFRTEAIGNDGLGRAMYLHTSPEFAMKKLLAAGEERIFALTHVWRNRERGPLHSPEFTMLEWYRVAEDYTQLMQDCTDLMQLACAVAGSASFTPTMPYCSASAIRMMRAPSAVKRYAARP